MFSIHATKPLAIRIGLLGIPLGLIFGLGTSWFDQMVNQSGSGHGRKRGEGHLIRLGPQMRRQTAMS